MSYNYNEFGENDEHVLIKPDDPQKFEKEYYNSNLNFRTFVINCRLGVHSQNAIDENLITLYEYFKMWEKNQEKIKKKKEKISNFVFITIQDFQRRIEDLDKIQTFIKRIHYLYSECYYVIEAGKSEPPNVHIHLLCKIINPRKHKQKINLEWTKLFDTSLYDKDFYKLTQWRKSELMPDYEAWVEEKLEYFDDTKKGTHQNSIDLQISGSWGLQ